MQKIKFISLPAVLIVFTIIGLFFWDKIFLSPDKYLIGYEALETKNYHPQTDTLRFFFYILVSLVPFFIFLLNFYKEKTFSIKEIINLNCTSKEKYSHNIFDYLFYFIIIATLLNFTLINFEDFFNGEILGQKKYLRDLSKGNQKKAGIIAALIGNPQVIILDEPFANLDPTTQIRLKRLMKELTENREVTLLVSSHDLLHVTEVCERIVVLEKGEVVKDLAKSPETLKELEEHFNR